ncbi:GMC oxidoreductase [Collybia nuda]|uniref:GMC oxidoreductase n=1 Tax=Collybia nuda TaxID=64659 RepID=A0A9P6CF96_9AGAR|nr:GMC oxidoreductase [Collybia nuda]
MPFVTVADVKDKVYDFVIIGGGTAGLLIAGRISQNVSTTVLVLDAGKSNLGDPVIVRPGQFGGTFMNPDYDWAFMTVPQPFANGRPLFWPRGKSLGGSSAMNSAMWSKPPKVDINAWEKLGNPGWNWENYQRISEGLASFTPNNEEITRYSEPFQAPWREPFGHGPIKLMPTKRVLPAQLKMQDTFVNAGLPIAASPDKGVPDGCYIAPMTLDPINHERSYAPNEFLLPHLERANLQVLTEAHANRIITSAGSDGLVATGVEFSVGNEVCIAQVAKEVIICAGTIKSPQILELSGIGNPEVLNRAGIPVKVALNGVGENVQEHLHVDLSFQLKDGAPDNTLDVLRDPEVAMKHMALFEQGEGALMISPNPFAYCSLSTVSPRADALLADVRKKIDSEKAKYPPGRLEQYEVMLSKIENGAPGFEVVVFPGHVSAPKQPEPGKKYITLAAATNYNFSRGSIHIQSNDPKDPLLIDPHCFEHEFDAQVFLDMVKFIRRIAATAPISDYFEGSPKEAEANLGAEFDTDEKIMDFIKTFAASTWHTAGSLAMLPKDKNGVVDAELKVYGTKNIRVADMSVVPLHISGHPVATAYAIGGFAAEIIQRSA